MCVEVLKVTINKTPTSRDYHIVGFSRIALCFAQDQKKWLFMFWIMVFVSHRRLSEG